MQIFLPKCKGSPLDFTPQQMIPSRQSTMRVFAAFNLCYLFFLVSSVFSSVHVDHQNSHETQCTPEHITFECHSDLPHEHEAAHPGEDSLLEHAFEDGASLLKSYALAVTASYCAVEITITPEIFLSYVAPAEAPPLHSSGRCSYKSSRAPPQTATV